MKVTFGKEGSVTQAVPVPAPAPAAPVAPAEPTVVGPPPEAGTTTAVQVVAPAPVPAARTVTVDDDKIALADVKIPALNIVQGVGDLSTLFTAGSIVYDQHIVLADSPPKPSETTKPPQVPVNLVLIGFRPTRWAEKVDGGDRGRILASPSDVLAVGGTTVYDEAYQGSGKERKLVKPYFTPLATALVLIEAPAGLKLEEPVENTFPLAVDEAQPDGTTKTRNFVIGFWHLRGTAHTAVAKPAKTARLFGPLRSGGYRSKWLSVSTVMKTFDGNVAYIPAMKIGADTSPEVRELAQSVLDGLMSAS